MLRSMCVFNALLSVVGIGTDPLGFELRGLDDTIAFQRLVCWCESTLGRVGCGDISSDWNNELTFYISKNSM